MNIKQEDLVSGEQAAEMLNISLSQLKELSKTKKLTKVKDQLNKSFTYYLKSEINDLLKNRFYVVEK